MHPAACKRGKGRHNDAARQKLPAGEHNGVFVCGEPFDQHAGDRIGKGGKDDRALSIQRKAAEAAGFKMDKHNARKTYKNADKLWCGQFFHFKYYGGKKERQKYIQRNKYAGFYAAGVRKADIKRRILQDRLKQTEQKAMPDLRFIPRIKRLFSNERAEEDNERARKRKTYAGKEDLRRRIAFGDRKHFVADLNHGKSAAPQKAAQQRERHHDIKF